VATDETDGYTEDGLGPIGILPVLKLTDVHSTSKLNKHFSVKYFHYWLECTAMKRVAAKYLGHLMLNKLVSRFIMHCEQYHTVTRLILTRNLFSLKIQEIVTLTFQI